jgi:hypothetical protein
MIFVPLLHYFLWPNDYGGNEAGLRYRVTPGKRTVPDPGGGSDSTREERSSQWILARALRIARTTLP